MPKMTELWAKNACPLYVGARTIFDLWQVRHFLPIFGQTKKYFFYPNDM